jgi:hypothetical protein
MPSICPNCKTGELHIFDVPAEVRIASDGEVDDVVGDLEWPSSNRAECLRCGWKGTAGECAVDHVREPEDSAPGSPAAGP